MAHRVLHYDHHMVAMIINACSVLHNICNRHRLPVPQLPHDDVVNDLNHRVPRTPLAVGADSEQQLLASGRLQRVRIVQRLWSAPRQ